MFFTCILRCDDTNHDTFTLQSNEIARAMDSYDTFLNQKPFLLRFLVMYRRRVSGIVVM